jgi:hypothetical protein
MRGPGIGLTAQAMVHLMNTLSQRMLDTLTNEGLQSMALYPHRPGKSQTKDIHSNLATVALLPVNGSVPISQFAEKLVEALSKIGNTRKKRSLTTRPDAAP